MPSLPFLPIFRTQDSSCKDREGRKGERGSPLRPSLPSSPLPTNKKKGHLPCVPPLRNTLPRFSQEPSKQWPYTCLLQSLLSLPASLPYSEMCLSAVAQWQLPDMGHGLNMHPQRLAVGEQKESSPGPKTAQGLRGEAVDLGAPSAVCSLLLSCNAARAGELRALPHLHKPNVVL